MAIRKRTNAYVWTYFRQQRLYRDLDTIDRYFTHFFGARPPIRLYNAVAVSVAAFTLLAVGVLKASEFFISDSDFSESRFVRFPEPLFSSFFHVKGRAQHKQPLGAKDDV